VLTLHAEFMYTANCGHALDCEKWKYGCGNCPRYKQETKSWLIDNTARSFQKMKKAFAGFDHHLTITSVSPWLMERAQQSEILGGKTHVVVLNGIDTNVFRPYETSELREKYGAQGEKIVFHATPYFSDDRDHFKGGYFVLELAKLLQHMKFVVAGDYRQGMEVPPNVILLGRITDQKELAKHYSMADVTVLASKKETFSWLQQNPYAAVRLL
jgi:glycosyltransferase involved in cell wall biosynthesis